MSNRWCFTINNYKKCDVDWVESLFNDHGATYAVAGHEIGLELCTPHLQGFVTFPGKVKKRLSAMKKLHGTAHWEVTRSLSTTNAAYCKKGLQSKDEWSSLGIKGPNYGKEAIFKEYGELPFQGKRTDLSLMASAIREGTSLADVAELDPATYIRNYRGLANYASLQVRDYEHGDVRGIWIWGPPGTGKSHHARLINPSSMYIKSQSKWFDGYAGEEIIILDDLDFSGLGHNIKLWSDKYPVSGEIKGGTVKLRHKTFVVTSNYLPSHLWPDDTSMCAAIERRFRIIYLSEKRASLF